MSTIWRDTGLVCYVCVPVCHFVHAWAGLNIRVLGARPLGLQRGQFFLMELEVVISYGVLSSTTIRGVQTGRHLEMPCYHFVNAQRCPV